MYIEGLSNTRLLKPLMQPKWLELQTNARSVTLLRRQGNSRYHLALPLFTHTLRSVRSRDLMFSLGDRKLKLCYC